MSTTAFTSSWISSFLEYNNYQSDSSENISEFLSLETNSPIVDWISEFQEIEIYIDKNQFNIISRFLIKYLIVGTCGSIEKSCKNIIYSAITKNNPGPLIQNYFEKNLLEKSLNPKHDQICGILKSYNKEWAKNFKREAFSRSCDVQALDSLDSLVELRNLIAHGNSQSISSSKDEIKKYFIDCIIVLREIERIVSN